MNLKSYKKLTVWILVFVLTGFHSFAETYTVKTVKEFNSAQKQAVSGDSICWKEGRFLDQNITLETDGIFFTAEKPGSVVFSGSSGLLVNGNGNTVSGFQFVGGKVEDNVIDVFGSKNTISQINIQAYDSHYYLHIRPNCQYNLVSYCNFESKPEIQESSVVQVEATEGLPGYHKIAWCSFKNFTAPPGAGADYGIEALRIGYSYQRTLISRTIVEYCYFEKCNGDYEIISNKACENVLRYNTFKNNGPAHLTLRHGSRAMVYGNFFYEGAGIRIKEGQNHSVINNYFDTGDQMALQLANHHFDPVDSVTVLNNTFVSCSPIKLGGKGDFKPKHVVFANNVFSENVDPLSTDPTNTESWNVNIYQSKKEMIPDGFTPVAFKMHKNKYGFFEMNFPEKFLNEFVGKKLPVFNIPLLDDESTVEYDIVKQKRADKSVEVPGCYLFSKNKPLNYFASGENTGPIYLK
jgi:hypothetical protein